LIEHIPCVPDLVRTASVAGPNLDLDGILVHAPLVDDERVTYAIAVILFTIGKVETLVHVCPDKTVRPLVKERKKSSRKYMASQWKNGRRALS
jgi:hypothetical protein